MGSKGMLQIENQSNSSLVTATATGISGDTLLPSFPERFAPAYIAELHHLVEVMHRTTEPMVTRRDAVMATAVAEACKISDERGCRVAIVEGNGRNPQLVPQA
jgi:myo-inositol 2-dehydrogenase/D-chiro-inositol 1-dehydrogenase